MSKIIIITNMEQKYINLKLGQVDSKLDNKVSLELELLNDTESWSKSWEEKLLQADFALVSWMGTGLCCPFLKQASKFMQKHSVKHYFKIMDAGDDLLEKGISNIEKKTLLNYLTYGGIKNYSNLWRWLASTFAKISCSYDEPQSMPWSGIYHPQHQTLLSTKEYLALKNKDNKPVVGMIFSREDWLWKKTSYHDVVIKIIEEQEMVPLVIFTNNMGQGEVAGCLKNSMKEFFYVDDKSVIDVLINNFVFSLTVTRSIEVAALQDLGVPILQAYHLYNSYEWWRESYVGMSANELSYAIALPEFDGIIHSLPVTTQELGSDGYHYREILTDRVIKLVAKAKKWAVLRKKNNFSKKIAIVFHNYPPTNSNIGSATSLDSIESVRLLLKKLQDEGYNVPNIPQDTKEFIELITSNATNDERFISEQQLKKAYGKLSKQQYEKFFKTLPQNVQKQLVQDWGEVPGEVFCYDDELLIPGVINGNIYITVQPPRGFGADPGKIYHSPDCAPTHHYLGFYHWLEGVWGADAMIHVGTHGNLEWLPGKGVAMSAACYSEIATGIMPNLYHYWITCVGEGIQAKRRSAATLISYLSAPMTLAGVYEELEELEKLLEEYIHFSTDELQQQTKDKLENMIKEKALDCNITDIESENFSEYLGKLHQYITDLKNMQIHNGLHILGQPPRDEEFLEYLWQLTRLENGNVPSLPKTLAQIQGYEYYDLLEHSNKLDGSGTKTYGILLDEINECGRKIIALLAQNNFELTTIPKVFSLQELQNIVADEMEILTVTLKYLCQVIVPNLLLTTLEIDNTIEGLNGSYIEPSPSGAPTSGGADLLPTGRNFYSVDPKTLPTEVAWEIAKQMGDDVIGRFIKEEGHYPESVGIIFWATSNLRNHGQCIAEFLYLMGLKPVWQSGSRRVIDLDVIPLEELKRPRIDVTGRISGLFRDSMVSSIELINKAVAIVANLEESLDLNFVKKHILAESAQLSADGMEEAEAWRQASYRLFGDPPGAHGAGVGNVLEEKNWDNIDDLAKVYVIWGGHAYGEGSAGKYLPKIFEQRLKTMEVTIQNIDHRESSMLAGDDYNNYRGGLVAAVRSVRGEMPRNYVSDSSDRSKVQLRSLNEELTRWFRGEAMNPKYIEGMKKHGYKGAADMATYVAVSYQWDATSAVMEDWMYEKYAEKYAFDKDIQEWMKTVNPWALQRIAEVLLEANQRGLWKAKAETKQKLAELMLEMEGELEELHDE